jgi:hypothetical protein
MNYANSLLIAYDNKSYNKPTEEAINTICWSDDDSDNLNSNNSNHISCAKSKNNKLKSSKTKSSKTKGTDGKKR